MTFHAQVEAAQSVSGKTITTTLKYNSFWSVVFHDSFDDRFEDRFVGGIVNPISKRKVDRVVLALSDTIVTELTSPREVLSIFVEGSSHDSVGGIESFLNTITVMDIDVNVKNSLLVSEELNDAKNDV